MKQELKKYGLFSLLKTLIARQVTGLLQITSKDARFDVFIQRGVVVYIHSSQSDLSLPVFLVKSGLINRETLTRVVEYARNRKLSFENALKKMDILDNASFERAKQTHQNTLLSFVFSLEQVSIELKEQGLPDALKDVKPLDVFTDLCRGIVEINDVTYMKDLLAPILEQGFKVSPAVIDVVPTLEETVGTHDLLTWIKNGEYQNISMSLLDDELAVKLLFILYLDDKIKVSSVELPVETDPVLKSLVSQLKEMMNLNYFQVLGVNVDAPVSVIQASYNQLKRKFSVSKYEGTTYQDRVEDYIGRIHEILDRANETLTNKTKRLDYMRSLKIDSDNLITKVNDMFGAHQVFITGLKAFDAGQLREAETLFGQASELYPDDPIYLVYQVKVKLQSMSNSDSRLEGLRTQLLDALKKAPEHPEVLFALAQLETKVGNTGQAISYAKRVLSNDPGHSNAKALLRIHSSHPETMQVKKGSKIPWQHIFDIIKGVKGGGKK